MIFQTCLIAESEVWRGASKIIDVITSPFNPPRAEIYFCVSCPLTLVVQLIPLQSFGGFGDFEPIYDLGHIVLARPHE